jgi:hypothetical protein
VTRRLGNVSRAKPRQPRYLSEWPREKLKGCTDIVRIGGCGFGLPLREDEQVQLANLSWERADRVFVGNEELAPAWNWSVRSLEELSKRASRALRAGEPYSLFYTWFNELPRENRQLVMPADYAMLIYKDHVLGEKVRWAPVTPGTKQKPGTRRWNHRIRFDVQFDEQLFTEAERESEQAARDYERYVSGNYNESDDEASDGSVYA